MDNEIEKDKKLESHYRRLGTRNPSCSICEEKEPIALTGFHPNIICYQCQAIKDGKSGMEDHHFAGKNNDPMTVPIFANDHRILSENQQDWPKETLRNPSGSPLLRAAASLRGFLAMLWLLIERILGWIPPFLEWLDQLLKKEKGEVWWKKLQFPQ